MNPNLKRPNDLTSPAPQTFRRPQVEILGVGIDALSRTELIDRAASLLTSFERHQIVTANSLMILEAQTNLLLARVIQKASLVVPDSSGVSWAALTLHLSRLHRFPGIDLAFELCGLAESLGIPVYLLGGESKIARKAGDYLFSHLPRLQIAGMRDGYFKERDEKSIFDDIGASRARLILVGLGMPKQELWIHDRLPHMPPGVYMGVGGAFDVWAGRLKRAPTLFRRTGMEWFYRLRQEPARWPRIAKLPEFAFRVFKSRF